MANTMYYVESCQEATSVKGTKYLSFVLNDGEARVSGNAFGVKADASQYLHKVIMCNLKKSGDFVNVENIIVLGGVEKLPVGHPILKLNLRSNITPEQALNYIRSLYYDVIEDKFVQFLEFVDLKQMLQSYGKYPAGLSIHHDIEGGLLQHTMEILDAYVNLTKANQLKDLRHSFSILAILWHDNGKLKEYNPKVWEVTPEYPLLGHMYMSTRSFEEAVDDFNKSHDYIISEVEKECIMHCILAHHGKLEWGSPVTPCMPEAYLVHMCDMISARVFQYKKAIHMEKDRYLGMCVDYRKLD